MGGLFGSGDGAPHRAYVLRSQYLLPTDPPNLSWSDGSLEPVEEELVEGEWELQVHAANTDSDGWHYAFNWEFVFHAAVTRQDLVRKRIWLRRRHQDVHAAAHHHHGGIVGCIRVILTPEEEGAVLERAGCPSGVVDEVECVHADMGRLAPVEGKLVCPEPTGVDMDHVAGKIALVRVDADAAQGTVGPPFVDEALQAAAAGASAVLLVCSTQHWQTRPSCSNGVDQASDLRVPVVWVRECDGGHLRAGATCQLSFNLRPGAASVTDVRSTSAAASRGKEKLTGEWEWAGESETSDDDDDAGEEEGEMQGDKESWMQESKKALRDKARWIASLASSHAPPPPSGAAAPEWAVEEDGGEHGGAARQGEDGLVGIGRALAGDVQRDLSEVQQMLEDNVRFFSGCPEQTLKHYKRCTELCVAAMITLHGMGAVVEAVSAVAEKHDISPEVAGNGFWAQLRVLSCCLKKIKGKLRTMASERDSLLFGTRVKTLLHGLTPSFPPSLPPSLPPFLPSFPALLGCAPECVEQDEQQQRCVQCVDMRRPALLTLLALSRVRVAKCTRLDTVDKAPKAPPTPGCLAHAEA